MKQILTFLVLLVLLGPTTAQKSNRLPLGWDLTYSTGLKANRVAPNEWLWKWLGYNYQSPVAKLILDWNDETIKSSISY
jgi:hypothetical protein